MSLAGLVDPLKDAQCPSQARCGAFDTGAGLYHKTASSEAEICFIIPNRLAPEATKKSPEFLGANH